eukprot:CAMPEP_0171074342 /NCGR_PEP_ID=MMETSP0766_2-20121228/12081_1 /TAXON_ID=439317 /ORGANISM="Gambierdiscus australes, Strain CAWD 149" /LENGTH=145 /DNA_ID=CAMNT_0011531119 /DNA_START=51 /DNA_END=485 /DNA_ORIENTATION=+
MTRTHSLAFQMLCDEDLKCAGRDRQSLAKGDDLVELHCLADVDGHGTLKCQQRSFAAFRREAFVGGQSRQTFTDWGTPLPELVADFNALLPQVDNTKEPDAVDVFPKKRRRDRFQQRLRALLATGSVKSTTSAVTHARPVPRVAW